MVKCCDKAVEGGVCLKRIGIGLFLCVLLMGFFVLPASAESAASRVDIYCTVSAEGSCQVNMTVTLRMEYVTTSMSFPLPANATGITLNGASVSTSKTSSATLVDISQLYPAQIRGRCDRRQQAGAAAEHRFAQRL